VCAEISLAGEVAVVTGVCGRLGPVWATTLLNAGASVVGIDIRAEASQPPKGVDLEALVGQYLGIQADITDRPSLHRAMMTHADQFGPASILVNNAGIDRPPSAEGRSWLFGDVPEDLSTSILDVNAAGTLRACQVYGSEMARQRKGSIINIGSLYGIVAPDPRLYAHLDLEPPFLKPPAYGMSKAAVAGLTRYLAALWGETGVRVNTLSPGMRRLGGLPGHPDVHTPHMPFNTGSLGMGISKAKGVVLANRLLGRNQRVYVMTGDGELQEGQVWEALGSAANAGMGEITAIVDHNKIQSDTWVRDVSDLGDLAAKFEAFGWGVLRCDGNDPSQLDAIFRERVTAFGDHPAVIIADTVKGAGCPTFAATGMAPGEWRYRFHSGAPPDTVYKAAHAELLAAAADILRRHNLAPLELRSASPPRRGGPPPPPRPRRRGRCRGPAPPPTGRPARSGSPRTGCTRAGRRTPSRR
jgi:transketolase N-terminal domain/subunit